MRLRALALAAALGITASTPAWPEIRVGLAAPLTGRMAATGLSMRQALESEVTEINATGGVLGQPLVLVVEDDGCASTTGEGAARQLISQGVAVVIGHPCSNAAVAAASTYSQAGVLLIAVGARHPDVTRGPATVPVVRLAGRDDKQGHAAASWLISRAPSRRVAIIHDRTAYARGIVDAAVASLKATGAEPVAMLPIVAGKHEYGDAALKLRDSHAEAALFVGYPEEAGVIVSGLEALGASIPLLGSDSLATPEFANTVERSHLPIEVLLPAEPKDENTDAPGVRVRGAFEAWVQAVKGVGETSGTALAARFREGAPFATRSLGEIRFDLNGDLDTPGFLAASARSGRWVVGR
ncbi:branched-chain amino acid ABC transporter substrate-binding protein [Hyphomicrobium sp.]|uniref:branched-chain amino acid ABC transporter substrate-binding protein n=1 Tax=Hyphomicrobium sp. TaxID=82 RepID=UPI002E332F0B|nr:branched-chain amino acid ABC transporter substrate-binding protein [Hyphomicrobium sp.]HEX2843177.1 branched-chain amino acid ABC transporter substrate-binding protein [Hyphomicrobium sp.]